MKVTRRGFLKQSVQAGGLTFLGYRGIQAASSAGLSAEIQLSSGAFRGGTFLRIVPFVGENDDAVGNLTGSGLGGRLALDLSSLTSDTLITPNDQFFIRTRYPDQLDRRTAWKVTANGLLEKPLEWSLSELLLLEEPMGVCLLECSGNRGNRHFGLISAARWSGVSMYKLLAKMDLSPRATRLLISGFDPHSEPNPGSVPGASWIFTLEQLESAGAFLATGMNAVPLPFDHGHPVRLVVPGWYGCTCIKWVHQIVALDETAAATAQMTEYAGRTHQEGQPKLARDFKPATIDQAAMPVRVEQWQVDGIPYYRVVGALWGGSQPTKALEIRFNPDQEYLPVEEYQQQTHKTRSLWSHTWRPEAAGQFRIQLRVNDPNVQTRRLDRAYYVRTVDVTSV